MADPASHHKKKHPEPPVNPPETNGQPVFAQPKPSPDPSGFKDPVTDQSYSEVTTLGIVPAAGGGAVEPILTLEEVYGAAGAAKVQAIQQSGQIVFHSVGDTGSVVGPETQSLVADKMVTDFSEADAADVPSFLFHLGDVVYYFGEATYYYDQFYEPYRDYIPRRFLRLRVITMGWCIQRILHRHLTPFCVTSARLLLRRRRMREICCARR